MKKPTANGTLQKRVLVIDDDAAIVDAIQMLLEMDNYEVAISYGDDAIPKAQQVVPDVILLDIWMSGQDGRDVAIKLKELPDTKHIPIIMISANREAEKLAMQCGANGFLAKPFEADDLINIVKSQIN